MSEENLVILTLLVSDDILNSVNQFLKPVSVMRFSHHRINDFGFHAMFFLKAPERPALETLILFL